jgi:hypothetical protein
MVSGYARGVSEKARENRIRAAAGRRGFTASKSRRRDRFAIDYGWWTVTRDGREVAQLRTLDELERWLDSEGMRITGAGDQDETEGTS